MNLTFEQLRYANVQRNKEWDPDNTITGAFRGLEFSGEIGELIETALVLTSDLAKATGKVTNMVKKLERQRLGLVGSQVTVLDLAKEFADCQITLDLLAMHYSIDLGEVTAMKFNATSEKLGWKTKIESKPNYGTPTWPEPKGAGPYYGDDPECIPGN